ncbi:MAG: NAD-dependent deacylase [Thermodesulfobacteriota bacterium]
MSDSISSAVGVLKKSKKTIALTGAGVSTESGIPDFRSRDGLWSRFDPMEYATLGAFKKDPAKVWGMLTELIAIVDAKANAGHFAMAEMEKTGILAGIITQNIDSLHQKAGSMNVVEFHGSLNSFTCLHCESSYPLDSILKQDMLPTCSQCQALLKPDIVFFDEQIPSSAISQTQDLVHGADVLIVAGTSCQVVPAATIPSSVRAQGGKIIEINTEPVFGGGPAIVLEGKFSEIMPQLLEALL